MDSFSAGWIQPHDPEWHAPMMSGAGPHSHDREDAVAGGGVLQLTSSHFKSITLIIQRN